MRIIGGIIDGRKLGIDINDFPPDGGRMSVIHKGEDIFASSDCITMSNEDSEKMLNNLKNFLKNIDFETKPAIFDTEPYIIKIQNEKEE